MKILLTQSEGRIVSDCIELYKHKHELFVPADEERDLTQAENATHLFAGEQYDAAVFFADRYATDADRLIAFKNVQYAAIAAGVKKLITVLPAEPPESGARLDMTEKDFESARPPVCGALSAYFIPALSQKDKISTVLRTFAVYGKYDTAEDNEILSVLAPALVGKKPVTIPADATFSAVYAEDVCRIIERFIVNDYPRGVYNVASPTPVTYEEFAKKAKAYARKAGREISVDTTPKRRAPSFTACVDTLVQTVGGFKFTSLATGVTKTLDYYAKHKSALK